VESLFGLLGGILDFFLSIFPRLVIIRATHHGVKWRHGKEPLAVEPGLAWYWPLVTEMELQVVARQTLNLQTQVLMTRDRKQVVVGAFVVYKISDVVQAIGERNWDVESTVADITQAAIVEEIMGRNLDDLLAGASDGKSSELNKALTANCQKELRQFGVHVGRAGLTDFSTCKVHKVLGGDITQMTQATSHEG
jgi:regulator of protease activity HflC (stomatin/prohibitin superfamily)